MASEVHTRRWATLRRTYAVAMRTGNAYTCPYCDQPVTADQPWDLDHVRPVAWGGSADHGVRPAHRQCNRRAGARGRQPMPTLTHYEPASTWTPTPPPAQEIEPSQIW